MPSERIVFKAPFNSLSFGQVAYNLVKVMFERGMDVSIFPQNGTVDLAAYSHYLSKDFTAWFSNACDSRYKNISKDTRCINLWHIAGSENKLTNKNSLVTFHELTELSDTEKAILSLHEDIYVSSDFSKDVFSKAGIQSKVFELGFDKTIEARPQRPLPDTVHFSLIGKWEKRKNTERIIKSWMSLFGNRKEYRLTCLVENPFLNPEQMTSLIQRVIGGCWNVSFLPRLASNEAVADFYNSVDVDLSGLSSAEGWNLPAFNATCLGKWSCVSNCTAHKNWATEDNCILVEPSGEIEPWDNIFFKKGSPYNQGSVFEISEESIKEAMKKAEKLAKTINVKGQALKDKFTYERTLDTILGEK